jgi:Phage integrase family
MNNRLRRAQLREIDLHWHDLRHEGACRLLADGVDIRVVQLILGHSDIKTTQRYLNITGEELRKALTGVWERRRQLKAVGTGRQAIDARAVGHWRQPDMTVSHGKLSVICQSSLAVTDARHRNRLISSGNVARPAGLEPATSWFVARRSIQLS